MAQTIAEIPAARRIQRTFLTLTLGNTLAASFIWGVNTLFLLDAGLTNLEAFAANAFFTLGMVIFEIPTGIVADTVGRRASFLLGTLVLSAATLAYWLMWLWSAPFWGWALVSIGLGLGFTFFSGAVEAWLVDALQASGYKGDLEPVFSKGMIVGGIAMLAGSVLGGIVAQLTNLGVPFLLRAGILAIMFVVAFIAMRDIGFTPDKSETPLKAVRTVFRGSLKHGLGNPPVRYLMLAAPFTAGSRHLRLLRAAAVPARVVGRPEGLLDRRPRCRGDRRIADRRRIPRAPSCASSSRSGRPC